MNPKIKHSRDRAFKRFVYIFFFLMCACFVLPLIVVISASFTSEQALTSGGFSLLPRDFTLDAYKSAFSSGTRVLRAYGVTIFQAVVGTVLSSLVAALAAYPLSRSNFRFRRPITVFIFFTMLFGAGMIPNYIIFAKYYKLADSIWIYILPGITGGAWNTMVFRTFFKGLPETLFEAAYLDGASELRIFFSVVLPLSTPVFASLGFMRLMLGQHVYVEPDIGQQEVKTGIWLSDYFINDVDSNPYVWADDGNGKLEKRSVTLGTYDENMMEYQITDGLKEEDAITFPEDGLEEGMKTVVSTDGSLGQSNPAGGEDDGMLDNDDGMVDDGMTQDENGMVDNTMDGAEYSGEEDTTNVIGGADNGEAEPADTQEAGSADDGEVQP